MESVNKKIYLLIGFLLVISIPLSNIANAQCPMYPDEQINPTISITGGSVTNGIVNISVSFTAGTRIWYDKDGNITTICYGEIYQLSLYIYTSDGNKFGERHFSIDRVYSGWDTLQWVSPSFAQDTYTLKVYARDTITTSAPATASVFVDNPLPRITSPADGSTVQGVVDITCEFFSTKGMRELWLEVYDAMCPYCKQVSELGHMFSEPYPTYGTYTFHWQSQSFTQGAYNLVVLAKEYYGATGLAELRYARSDPVTVILVKETPVQEMVKPVGGYLYSGYGPRSGGFHYGIDIVGLTPGDIAGRPVVAAASGVVTNVGGPVAGDGYFIKIGHGDIEKKDGTLVADVSTYYCHLQALPPFAKNAPVTQGQFIGNVGDTGVPGNYHLHFEVHDPLAITPSNPWGKVDPLGYLYYSPRPRKGFKIEARCPIDITVIDPEGYLVSKNSIEIEETVTYLEEDFDGDGDLDDRIWFYDRKIGDYTITVVPQPDALPDDTYSLEVTADDETIILAENVPVSDIPDEPYIIRSTETDIIRVIHEPAPIEASINIDNAKIDFKKKPDDDKVRVSGKLELDLVNGDGVDISEDVIVTVGPLSETITMEEMGKKGEKWEYKRPKHGDGNIKHMTVNWKNGKFDIRMDKADLSGITNPVTISVQIGDDVGSESILMREKKHHWDYKASN